MSQITETQLKKIFAQHGLEEPQKLEKVAVGFTNKVFSVDDKYILKVCADVSNEQNFRIEAVLYGFFKGKLPVPELVIYDDSKEAIPSHYMVYKKITGDNLYNVWHTLSVEERRKVTKQLCSLLKIINQTPVSDLPDGAILKPLPSWRDHIIGEIDKSLRVVSEAGTLSTEEVASIKAYVQAHQDALNEADVALVYWDAHFDNVLVRGDEIVGLLDFERTELASTDFALDIVKRMVEQPKKYMSEYAEQFAKDEDYKDLLSWYKEFYPELFSSSDMDTRLNLYAIAHNLKDLEGWPDVAELKDGILEIVS